MKRILLALQLLLMLNLAYAQSYKENINTNFKTFGDLMREGKFDDAFDYVHPDLFQVVSKADMVKLTKQLFSSNQYSFKFLDFTTKNFKEPIIADNKYYVVFKYNSVIAMKFNDMDIDKQPLIQSALANKYGTENVSFDEKTGFFEINAEKKSIAISKNGTSDWKFINVEPEQRLIMEKILPKTVRDEIL